MEPSPYNEVRDLLGKAQTDADLFVAWKESQQYLRLLPQYARTWLVAMKDQRKRLIAEGGVIDYDEARVRCDLVDWCDHDARERIRTEANADRARAQLNRARGLTTFR